ncbi:hypothetical protein LMH87_004991 [Akanthomyces muscarius]|uniref:Uncharacterized protein n=1 Tax=Akanthomyces muscarius TaxID=2231603 RepID=A0A9W8QLM0_AKAMU|nr:hypothetical protein LMH87_004991 [Akanthomyces muscarius]KAJ4163250.1 hypothetical protein LMH87_004991 [Akanthomyces muscarius]
MRMATTDKVGLDSAIEYKLGWTWQFQYHVWKITGYPLCTGCVPRGAQVWCHSGMEWKNKVVKKDVGVKRMVGVFGTPTSKATEQKAFIDSLFVHDIPLM